MESRDARAAKQLEFERAAALRDEIQQIRLRVLQEDASIRSGGPQSGPAGSVMASAGWPARPTVLAADGALRQPSRRAGHGSHERRVLPADEEPADTLDGVPGEPDVDEGTVADWLPGIRDEHEDETGSQARWLDRPTWTAPSRRTSGSGPDSGRGVGGS